MHAKEYRRGGSFDIRVGGSAFIGFTWCIKPSLPLILHDVHLQLLDFGETLPLLRNHMVDFVVKVSDLEFCLQVDAIILGSALPIAKPPVGAGSS